MESRQHMWAGITALQHHQWRAALAHFDHAVALRTATPWQSETESAWLLAAAWINRSDALLSLHQPHAAISSLDQAISAMAHVPISENPAFADRLILAWIKHATASTDIGDHSAATTSFSTVHSLLRTYGSSTSISRSLLHATFFSNRSRLQLALAHPQAAYHDSLTATEILRELPRNDTTAAAFILALATHCHALATLLDVPDAHTLAGDWIARATDAAEEALSLAHQFADSSLWIADLLRYCAKIYRVCQPHFLGEFLTEWASPEKFPRSDAMLSYDLIQEIHLAKNALTHRVNLTPHQTHFVNRSIRTLQSLQLAEKNLRQIPNTTGTAVLHFSS